MMYVGQRNNECKYVVQRREREETKALPGNCESLERMSLFRDLGRMFARDGKTEKTIK